MSYKEILIGIKNNTKNKQVQQECTQILEQNLMSAPDQFDKVLSLLLNTNKIINQKQSLQQLYQMLPYLEYSQNYSQSLKMIAEYLRSFQLTQDEIIEQFINVIVRLVEQKELSSISQNDLMTILGKVTQLFISKAIIYRERYTIILHQLCKFIFFKLRNVQLQNKAFMSLLTTQDKANSFEINQLNPILMLELLDKLMTENYENIESINDICKYIMSNFDLYGEWLNLQTKTYFNHVQNTTDSQGCIYFYEKTLQYTKSQSQSMQIVYIYYYMKILHQCVNNNYSDQQFMDYVHNLIKYINKNTGVIYKNQEVSNCLLYTILHSINLVTQSEIKISQQIINDFVVMVTTYVPMLSKNDVANSIYIIKNIETDDQSSQLKLKPLIQIAIYNDSGVYWAYLLLQLLDVIVQNLKQPENPGTPIDSTKLIQLMFRIIESHDNIKFIIKLFTFAVQLLNQKKDFQINFSSVMHVFSKNNKKYSINLMCKLINILEKEIVQFDYVTEENYSQLNQCICQYIIQIMQQNNIQPEGLLEHSVNNKEINALTWHYNLPLNHLLIGTQDEEQDIPLYHTSYYSYLKGLIYMTLQSVKQEKNGQLRYYLTLILVIEILRMIVCNSKEYELQNTLNSKQYSKIMFNQVFSTDNTFQQLMNALLSDESTDLNTVCLLILQLLTLQQNNIILRQDDAYQKYKSVNLLGMLSEQSLSQDDKFQFMLDLLIEVFELNIEQTDISPVSQKYLQQFLLKIDDIIQSRSELDQKDNNQQEISNKQLIILHQHYLLNQLINKIQIQELDEQSQKAFLEHYGMQKNAVLRILQCLSLTSQFYKNCNLDFVYIVNLLNRIQKLYPPYPFSPNQLQSYLTFNSQDQKQVLWGGNEKELNYAISPGDEAESAQNVSDMGKVEKIQLFQTETRQSEQFYSDSGYEKRLFDFELSLLLKSYVVLFQQNQLDKKLFNAMLQTYFQNTTSALNFYLFVKLMASAEVFNKYVQEYFLIEIDDLQKIKLYHFEELVFMLLFYIQDFMIFKADFIDAKIIAEIIIDVQIKQMMHHHVAQLDQKIVVQQQLAGSMDQFVQLFITQIQQLDHLLTDANNNKQIISQIVQQFMKDDEIVVAQTLKNNLYNILTQLLSTCSNIFNSAFDNPQNGEKLIQTYVKITSYVDPLTITSKNGLQTSIQLLNKIYSSKQSIINVFGIAIEYFNRLDEINKYDKTQDDQVIIDSKETIVKGKYVQTMPEMAYLFFLQHVLKEYDFNSNETNTVICDFATKELIRILYNSFGITNSMYTDQIYKYIVTRLLDNYEDNKQLVTQMLGKYFQQYKQNYYNVRSCRYLTQQILLSMLQLINYNHDVFTDNITLYQDVSKFVYDQYSYDNLVLKYILFKQSIHHFNILDLKITCQNQILNIVDCLMPNINHSGQSGAQKLLIACDITQDEFEIIQFPDCDDFENIYQPIQEQYHRIQAIDTAFLEEFVLTSLLSFITQNQKSLQQLIIQLFVNTSRNYLQELSINGNCPINNQGNFIKFLQMFMEIDGIQRYVYKEACNLFLNNRVVSDELAQCGHKYFYLIGQFIEQVTSQQDHILTY